jgi:hypothetical protein
MRGKLPGRTAAISPILAQLRGVASLGSLAY